MISKIYKSTGHVKYEDIGWSDLISYAESQIEEHRRKVSELRKSIRFFKKQMDAGVQFRPTKTVDPKELK